MRRREIPGICCAVWMLCSCARAQPPPLPPPATAPAAAPAALAAPAPKAQEREWPALVYRRDDGALTDDHDEVLGNELPGEYALVAPRAAPEALRELLRGKKSVYEPVPKTGTCTEIVFERIAAQTARMHEDLQLDEQCLARYSYDLEYTPGPFGSAYVVEHTLGEPRILKGCEGVGFGIALCGEPEFFAVDMDDEHITFVDTHVRDYDRVAYAYRTPGIVAWYFDRKRCEAAAAVDHGCGA